MIDDSHDLESPQSANIDAPYDDLRVEPVAREMISGDEIVHGPQMGASNTLTDDIMPDGGTSNHDADMEDVGHDALIAAVDGKTSNIGEPRTFGHGKHMDLRGIKIENRSR